MNVVKFNPFLKRVYETTPIKSQNQLAQTLKISRSAISQAKRNNAVPVKWILQLAQQFNFNREWLEKGKGATFLSSTCNDSLELINVPKVKARLCAGDGSFDTDSKITSYLSFQFDWLRQIGSPKDMVLMDVFGNSMDPEIKDGDTIMVDQSQKDILAGLLYAVGIGDTIMVKRVEKHPNRLVLFSENTKYAPIFLEEEDLDRIRIIGKVVWTCRKLN